MKFTAASEVVEKLLPGNLHYAGSVKINTDQAHLIGRNGCASYGLIHKGSVGRRSGSTNLKFL